MICPYCGSTVEPARDAAGTLVCPACSNTGQVTGSVAPLVAMQPTGLSAPAPAPYAQPRTSGKAIAALVLGICAIVLWFTAIVTGPLAIIFGVQGLRQTKAVPQVQGRGMAIAGIVTGSIGVAVGVVVVLAAVVFVLVSNLGQAGSAPNVTFTPDASGIGGTLTVTSADPDVFWSDLAFSGTADCVLPFGQVQAGDRVDCSSDGTVRISHLPTNKLLFSGSV
jgi:hypothetical protein